MKNIPDTVIHKELLESGKWLQYSLMEQLANVGSDVIRAIKWKKFGDKELSQAALFRALELIDFTVADPKNRGRLKEVLRAREALVDFFMYDNIYQSTDEQW